MVTISTQRKGEQCTVVADGFYGRTGRLQRQTGSDWLISFHGSSGLYFFRESELVPESRNYDYEWQRERNLL